MSQPNRIESALRVAILTLAVCLVFVASAWACEGCKDALAENDPTKAGIARGFYWSILFMMSVPYLLLSGFGLMMYFAVKKAKAAKLAAAEQAGKVASMLSDSSAPSQSITVEQQHREPAGV